MFSINTVKKNTDAIKFCDLFFNKKAVPRFVLGRNEYAANMAEHIDIDGFIDDFTDETEFMGKPILKMIEAPKNSLVVSAVIFVMPLTAIKNLKQRGLTCLDYFNFIKYSGVAFKEITFLRAAKEDISKHMKKYQWLHERLNDGKSKDILEKLLNFRFSCDLNYMEGFHFAPEHQYFEDFLDLKPGEVFVDAGGFDGQTSVSFIKKCPSYKSVYFFEPDPKNVNIARDNLSKHPHIHFYTLGLAESKKTLRFGSGEGSASRICETGDIEIQVDAIDHLINEPISFIKMDIEGSEGIAIEGSKKHILKDHPKLAICCYHQFDDIWKIPEQILGIRDDYSIYLRHYTDGLHETVMYFIPES